jgi:hypothetical protein
MHKGYYEDRNRGFYRFWYRIITRGIKKNESWKNDTTWDYIANIEKITKKTIFRIIQEQIDSDKMMEILDND